MSAKTRRLVVVSNRVADFSAKFQTGGLAVALGDALSASKGVWFGWSGETRGDAEQIHSACVLSVWLQESANRPVVTDRRFS